MSTFKELLGSSSQKKQEERIKELLLIEATPEITLQIRYNGIIDQVILNISGGDVSFDAIHRMLELTSKTIRREELSAAVQQQAQASSAADDMKKEVEE